MLNRIDLTASRNQLAGNLAHGQKQWLETGMALMSKPKLLLLDEPTAGMTLDETQKTANLIHQLAKETAVVAIEHDMNFVRALGCHTYVMHQGTIIRRRRLWRNRTQRAGQRCLFGEGVTMLEVRNLKAGYGVLPVLHDVSFNLKKGETLVLLGRNGVGKSTLLKSLIGINKPTSGDIFINGKNVTGLAPNRPSHDRAWLMYLRAVAFSRN